MLSFILNCQKLTRATGASVHQHTTPNSIASLTTTVSTVALPLQTLNTTATDPHLQVTALLLFQFGLAAAPITHLEAFQYSDDCHQAQACLTCAISAERHLGVLFGPLSCNLGQPPTFRAFSDSIAVQICCMVSRRLLHSEMGSQVQCGEDSFPEFQVCLGMLHRTVICMGDNSQQKYKFQKIKHF